MRPQPRRGAHGFGVSWFALAAVSWLPLLLLPTPARAGTASSTTWQALILDADFVGEVECTTAGLDVARFRVREAWKGLKAGQELTAAVPGVHLVGERSLLALVKTAGAPDPQVPPFGLGDSVDGLYTPLTWRALEADYETPAPRGQARLPLDPDADQPLRAFESPHPSLQAFHEAVGALLQASPQEQELRLLRSLARLLLARGERRDPALLKQVEAAGDVKQVLDLLVDARRYEVVCLGREQALARLEELGGFQPQLEEIRQRLGQEQRPPIERHLSGPALPEKVTPAELDQAFRVYAEDGPGSTRALRILLRDAPQRVFANLRTRVFDTWGEPYWLSSWVCVQAPEARRVDLTKPLLKAQDPWVRVTAAVYLSLWGDEAGPPALQGARALPGGPGAWAALTLARRGDAGSVPRALQVLGEAPDPDTQRARLRTRVRILLSNARRGSDAPPLPPWDAALAKKDPAAAGAPFLAWWKAHGEGLQVGDPWLKALEAQGRD